MDTVTIASTAPYPTKYSSINTLYESTLLHLLRLRRISVYRACMTQLSTVSTVAELTKDGAALGGKSRALLAPDVLDY